mgnify:CR=1 FL=1
MLALLIIFTSVGMFGLGRLVGREESMRHMLRYISHMRSELSDGDKALFDKWVKEYKDKYYPEN